jgi:ubiquinone/menaquinone biosynthesis C-methylase UbiE
MDRSEWLKERRRVAEERFDTLWAAIYDDNWGSWIGPTHQEFIQRFLSLCPPQATMLDAACGTGKYWPLILASGRAVRGTDQSREMLARAKAKFPDVPVEKIGLQEMQYQEAFEGAVCMDAMENVFPEDWPVVLHNLYRAIKPEGYLYLTVEIAAESDIQNAFAAGREEGLPIVYGEWMLEGGYHYYPSIKQVKAWLEGTRFRLVAEAVSEDYNHFLVQKAG